MILITGAAGKTGLAVLQALSRQGAAVRALVHRPEQSEAAKQAGAAEVIVGDLLDPAVMQKALAGVEGLYLICPNVHPKELEIGRVVIAAAKASGSPRIVYHSVMYPQLEAMPHHWQKLRAEEALISSGLDHTILQPASYMQNVLPYWAAMQERGEYKVPYSVYAKFTPIDLEDLAEVAALVLTDPAHSRAIYQLAGPETLSSRDMAIAIASVLGKEVRAIEEPLNEWVQAAKDRRIEPYAIDALTKMFAYYNNHGFVGRNFALEEILGRRATSFAEFLTKTG
jgi:uncharacterized protein YbjT (DUF2867 family)